MKVDKIRLGAMRDELHSEYHKSVLFIIDKLTGEALALIQLIVVLPAYRAAYAVEELVLDIITKSKLTKPISYKDSERDQIYKGLLGTVKAMLHHFDKEVQNAAGRVLDILKHYGKVSKKSYEEETAAIRDLLREFDNKDGMNDLQTLRVMDWIDRLQALNDAFETMVHQRDVEKAAQPLIRMKEARKDTDRRFRNMVVHLEYLQMIDRSSPELIAFITELNVMTKRYQDIMAHQRSRKKETPEKSEP